MFERLRRWLDGKLQCRLCGGMFYHMSLGYGEAICPDCYDGQDRFIFLDINFWLNRLVTRIRNRSE